MAPAERPARSPAAPQGAADGGGLGQEQQEEQFQLAMTDLVDLTRPTPHLEMMPRLSINNWRAAVAAVAILVVLYSHIVATHN